MALHFNEDALASVRRLTLSVDSGVLHEGICVKQGDSASRFIEITLQSEEDRIITPPEGAIPRLRCVKPDETLVISDGTIEGGRVLVELKEQMLTAPGFAYADIAVYDGDKVVLSTQLFQINITKKPFDDNTVESTDDFSALSQALLDAKAALKKADEAVAEAKKKVSPSWGQNDPTAPDYIDRRTHWIEEGIGDVWSEMSFSVAGGTEPMIITDDVTELTAGEEYTVRWNGGEYVCTAQGIEVGNPWSVAAISSLEGLNVIALGNLNIFSSDAAATSDPFAIAVVPGNLRDAAGGIAAAVFSLDGAMSGTLSITGKVEVYVPLDLRFIPEGIKAEQVQADFAQNDDTQPDHVKNRTHWVETVRSISKILPETVATYDETEGTFIILTELPLTEGSTYTVNWNGIKHDTVCQVMEGVPVLGDLYTATGGNLGTAATGEPFCLLAYPAEMMDGQPMLYIFPLDSSTELTLSITGETVTEIVHQLEDKFIPASWLPTRTVVERTVLETTAWGNRNQLYGYHLKNLKSLTVTLTVDGETLTETLAHTTKGIAEIFLMAVGKYVSMVNFNSSDEDGLVRISELTDSTPTDITITGEFYEYNQMPFQHMISVTVEELTHETLAGVSTLIQNGITVRYQDGVIIAAYANVDVILWCAVWVNGEGVHVESGGSKKTGLYLSAFGTQDTNVVHAPQETFKLTVDKNGIPTITGIDDTSKVWTPGEYLPAVTEEDNGKVLVVENGSWTAKSLSELTAAAVEE